MRRTLRKDDAGGAGDQLRKMVQFGSFGGLFFSLFGTGLIWAGADSFNCPAIIWKGSMIMNFVLFVLTWATYLPFRSTDLLLGNGLLTAFILISFFWLFGLAGFYFYFLFAPMNIWPRLIALIGVTAMLSRRAYIINSDIREALRKHKNLFNQMYCDEGASITFKREAIGLLEKSRRDRNPFKSIHAYAAIAVTPFVLVLNRLLTPVLGEGHGVFLVLAFFAVPMLLWGVGIFVQAIMTMIYYPIKLQRATGKPVLLKDW